MNQTLNTSTNPELRLTRPLQDALLIGCLWLLHGVFFVPAVLEYGEALTGRDPQFFARVVVGAITLVWVAQAGMVRVLRQALVSRWLIALHGIVFASTIWSIDRGETISAALALALATLLGVYLSTRYSLSDQMRLYTSAVLGVIVLSALVAILLPQFGVMTHPDHVGRWNGILRHKNNLGYMTALGVILLLYFPPAVRPSIRAGLLGVAVLVLIFAEAAVASAIAAGALALWGLSFVWRTWPHYRRALMIGAAAALIGGLLIVVVMGPAAIFNLMGRSSTLTGRSHLWQSALTTIEQRPILGYGYLASFAPNSPIHQYLRWKEAPHAHSLILDTVLGLGVVGLGIFAAQYGHALGGALRMYRRSPGREWGFAVMFFVFFVLSGLLDGNGLLIRNLYWVVYVALTLTVARGESMPPPESRSA